jgi:dipicolinate synthase subunit B
MDLSILKGKTVCFVMTGSFCTFEAAFAQARVLKEQYGMEILPVMSYHARTVDSRFGLAETHAHTLRSLSGRDIIEDINAAEPIGPKGMADILLVAPCTGNTMAKLTLSITDTPATMAVKSHLRSGKPVVLALASNDALAGSGKNIGALLNIKHYFFVPMSQDAPGKKPNSLVAHFDRIPETLASALNGKQIQPIMAG